MYYKRKNLYTTASLFSSVMAELEESEKILDGFIEYSLPTDYVRVIRKYEFNVLGTVEFGHSEGIYLHLFCNGDIGDGRGFCNTELGTVKTLRESDDAFRMMAVLMADFQLTAKKFIDENLDDFCWFGYNIDFFRKWDEGPRFGMTYRYEAGGFEKPVEYAWKILLHRDDCVFAVIRCNNEGKTVCDAHKDCIVFKNNPNKVFNLYELRVMDSLASCENDFNAYMLADHVPSFIEAYRAVNEAGMIVNGAQHVWSIAKSTICEACEKASDPKVQMKLPWLPINLSALEGKADG